MNAKIVCPFRVLENMMRIQAQGRNHCRSNECCFVCRKRRRCHVSYCGNFHQAIMPDSLRSCSVYPISENQAKSLAVLLKLSFVKETFSRFWSWDTDAYFEELRLMTGSNKWRRKVGRLR